MMSIPLLPDDVEIPGTASRPMIGREIAQAFDDAHDPSRDDYAPNGRPASLAEAAGVALGDRPLESTPPAGPIIWGERYGAHSTRTVMFPMVPDEPVKVVGRNEVGMPRRVSIHAIYPTPGGDYAAVAPTKSGALSGKGNKDGEGFLLTVPFTSYSDGEFWVYCNADSRVSVLIEFNG